MQITQIVREGRFSPGISAGLVENKKRLSQKIMKTDVPSVPKV